MQDEDIYLKKKASDDDVELVAQTKGKKKKDLSKFKCFKYDEMGHFSSRCLMKKKMGDKEKKKGR